MIARRPKEEQTLEDIVEALRLVAEDVGVDKLQTKMQITTFKDQITKLGKEKGEQLLLSQVDEVINDCKLDHDGDILIEDFAKYLLSK